MVPEMVVHRRTTEKPMKPVEGPEVHKTGNTKDSRLNKREGCETQARLQSSTTTPMITTFAI